MKIEGKSGLYVLGLIIAGIEHDKIFASDFNASDLDTITNPDEQSDITVDHVSDAMRDHERLVNSFTKIIHKTKELIKMFKKLPDSKKESVAAASNLHKHAELLVEAYKKICGMDSLLLLKSDSNTKNSKIKKIDLVRSKIKELESEVNVMSTARSPTNHHSTIRDVIESTFHAVKGIVYRDLE